MGWALSCQRPSTISRAIFSTSVSLTRRLRPWVSRRILCNRRVQFDRSRSQPASDLSQLFYKILNGNVPRRRFFFHGLAPMPQLGRFYISSGQLIERRQPSMSVCPTSAIATVKFERPLVQLSLIAGSQRRRRLSDNDTIPTTKEAGIKHPIADSSADRRGQAHGSKDLYPAQKEAMGSGGADGFWPSFVGGRG